MECLAHIVVSLGNNNKQTKHKNNKKKSSKMGAKKKSRSSMPRGVPRTPRAYVARSNRQVVKADGEVRRRSEMIQLIPSRAAFTKWVFPINPGLSAMFPWGHLRAKGYEKYRFTRLMVEFKSRCPSTQKGVFLMYNEYDAKDATAATYKEAVTMGGATSDNIWVNNALNGRRESIRQKRFLRTDTTIPTGDLTLYDVGTLVLITEGGAAADEGDTVGEVWIHYDLDLYIPQTTSAAEPTKVPGLMATIEASNHAETAPNVTTWDVDLMDDAAGTVSTDRKSVV